MSSLFPAIRLSADSTTLSLLYSSHEMPFGKSWSEWASIWCKWLFSIPKTRNPALDNSGSKAGVNQPNFPVWFLAGTFGNEQIVHRQCRVASGKAILFPVMLKECSLIEDKDLHSISELVARCKKDMDMVTSMQITLESIEGGTVYNLTANRIQSNEYDLDFPIDNVYDVTPGVTKSTSNGYWVFLKPLSSGNYRLSFKVEAALPDGYVVKDQLLNLDVYRPMRKYMENYDSFKIEIIYSLEIV